MRTAKHRFQTCKSEAKFRNIDWELTFDQWNNWWLSQGYDRNQPFANTSESPCMCRIGDVGSYRLDNIYCATRSQNSIDKSINKPTASKSIQTPFGKFNSIVEAAKIIPITPTPIGGKKNYIRHNCQNKIKGYQFL